MMEPGNGSKELNKKLKTLNANEKHTSTWHVLKRPFYQR